ASQADEEAERVARGELTEVEQLRLENEELKARLGEPPCTITPTESDITPPGEQGEFYRGGPRRGPDDPKPRSTAVIDARQRIKYYREKNRIRRQING